MFEKLVALAVIGVVGVVVVSVGAFVLVFVAVGVVATLLYVRFFPVRDPMLRAVKSFMMAQQLQKQAQKKMSRALDDAGARIRDQAGRLMLRHDHVLAEYGAIQKMSPLEMISVVAKDQPHEPVDASLGGVHVFTAKADAMGSGCYEPLVVDLIAECYLPTLEELLDREAEDETNPVQAFFAKHFGFGKRDTAAEGTDKEPAEAYRREYRVHFEALSGA